VVLEKNVGGNYEFELSYALSDFFYIAGNEEIRV
jgi:hypothetical protein